MASIGFRIKTKENKEASIYVYFRVPNSSVISSRTGFSVNPKNWSESKKRAKPSDPFLINLNNDLEGLKTFLNHSLNYDTKYGIEIDRRWLRKKVDEFNNKVPVNDKSYLLNFLDDSIEKLSIKRANDGSKGLKESTKKGYNTFRNVLKKYELSIGQNLKFNAIDKGVIDDFFKWLVDHQKYAKSQASRLMKRFKKLLKEAQIDGITLSINPDLIGNEYMFKPDKVINVITEKEFIELTKLKGLPDYLENARKWILIGLMIGQRVSDLLTLKEEQIRFENNEIALLDITQIKTNTQVTVPVNNHYVITILKNNFPHTISSQNFNKYIKEVFKRAGINQTIQGYRFNPKTKRKEKMEGPKYEFITSHDLRRSFATYHYDIGKPVGVIMKITGHKRESTFYDYIGKNPNKDFDAYNFLNG